MANIQSAFRSIARCEDVSTSSKLGRGDPLRPRHHRKKQAATARLNMRQPKEEQRIWKEVAGWLGVTLSDYVRAKVNDSELAVRRITDPAMLVEVRRAGINLNRLVRLLNASKAPQPSELDAALALFTAVYGRLLDDLER